MKFNIIFPMAGKGSRFGYKFKPFIKISDLTFIQLAFQPFLKHKKYINKVYFIITDEQNKDFLVNENLKKQFPNISYELITLDKDTSGPIETLSTAIIKNNLEGSSFICDCDHSINIDEIINLLEKNHDLDIIIPTYNLDEEDAMAWSKIYENDGNLINFSEKETLDEGDKIMGMIGCYYFKNIDYFKNLENNFENMSEIFKVLLNQTEKINIVTSEISKAEFFGDPKRLQDCINKRRNKKCVFCDIDGTLVYHKANPNYLLQDTILLNKTIETLKLWSKQNIYIVLTTARSKINEEKLKALLHSLNIRYDDLITGLPSGQRILINDVKPSQPFIEQAVSINLERNSGINNITFDLLDFNEKIVKVFKGNSFSKTLLLEKNGVLFVRKYIIKNKNNTRHYKKLQRQCFELQRFNTVCNTNICPKILNIVDNSYMFYIDIEYCDGYNTLCDNENLNSVLVDIFEILKENIYIMRKPLRSDNNWLQTYIKNRLRFSEYIKLHKSIDKLINIDTVNINGVQCHGMLKILNNNILLKKVKPKFLTTIHGDLTFENILYNSDNYDTKLIDMDGSDFIDACELDLGKLAQSLISKYEIWSVDKDILKKLDFDNKLIYTKEYSNTEKIEEYKEIFLEWCNILDDDYETTKIKAIFYMCTHLIRMIPYRYKVSLDQALFAIKEATLWLNEINIDL